MTKRPLSRSSSSVMERSSRSPVPSSSVSGVDPKLAHLVRKVLNNTSTNNTQDVDFIVNCLTTQYREYQRKDPAWLTTQVKRALLEQQSSQEQEQNQLTPKKRLHDEEKDYDAAALRHDAIQQQVPIGGGLNAGLRDRYKQVQQERQQAELVNAMSKQDVDATNTNAVSSTGKSKRIKRKRNLLRSSSSTMNSAGAGGAGDANAFTTPVERPTERYSDLGGLDQVLQQIRQLIEYPLVRPELYRHLGVDPPRGVLLRGPPGCGKSHLANAIAGQLNLPFFKVSAPELVAGMSGESEGRIRDLFQAASSTAPSLIFLDELDAICPKRSDNRGMEKRMVAQLLTCMDMIAPPYNANQAPVLVLGATNRPDAMDPALRRAGRFDKEILLGVPDEGAREAILKTMTNDMRLSGDFNFKVLARKTPGYVGADVRSLTKEAAVIAINRIFRDVLTNEGVESNHVQNENELETKGGSDEGKEETEQTYQMIAVQRER